MDPYKPWKPAEPDRSPAALRQDLRHFESLLKAKPESLDTYKVVVILKLQLGDIASEQEAEQLINAKKADLELPSNLRREAMEAKFADLI
jgi:hypothetical protein